jgi:hypothetical protein
MCQLFIFAEGKVIGTLADLRDEQLEKEKKLSRTGLHFLLDLKRFSDRE